MRRHVIFAIAGSEARLVRRLARYWIFVCLSLLVTLLGFVYFSVIHAMMSAISGAAVGPRYLLAQLGSWQLVVFAVGLVFLALDVRARDERERVAAVMDVRPYSNLELVVGRFLGILILAWIPVVLGAAAVQSLGALAELLDWPLGERIEPRSLVAFVVLMTIPTFALVISSTFLLAVVVRSRLVAALLGLAIVAGMVYLSLASPLYLVHVTDPIGGTSVVASELTPRLLDRDGFLQRLAVLTVAIGLLPLSAAWHPRLDGGSRERRLAAGGGLLLAGVALAGALAVAAVGARERFEDAVSTHRSRDDQTFADLRSIRGDVILEPRRSLRMELELDLSAPPGVDLERLLLTLNPGLRLASVAAADRDLPFAHARGLVEILLGEPLAAGDELRLALAISGRPDLSFSYLDSVRRLELEPMGDNQLSVRGVEAAVYDRRFVALMPGIHWLPTTGTATADRPADFFRLDLSVTVPPGWLVAGPGRREAAGENRYRFAPPAPLPEVALVASRFERRAAEVEGVELEVLLHPRHARILDVFAEAGEEIRGWVGERLRDARQLGLPYPYGALTLVEVPSRLRILGGGWRMDTVQAPPALLLVKETSLPTSRFELPFRNPRRFEEREGGIARAKREALERFFTNDFSGGNLFVGASRNFFRHQTAATGPEALALDYVATDLSNRLITGHPGYFAGHLSNAEVGVLLARAIPLYLARQRSLQRQAGVESIGLAEVLVGELADRPEVWDHVLDVSLADMDPWQDPARSLNALVLKGGAISRWLMDGLGRGKAAALLARLRSAHGGETFTTEDLRWAAAAVEADVDALLGDWLAQTALPGFVASKVRAYRLGDDEDGARRYQVVFRLHNGEAVPGLVRTSYGYGDTEDEALWLHGEPVLVPGGQSVEIGLLASKPIRRVTVDPYLSLNRGPFAVSVPSFDADEIRTVEPLRGARASDWRPGRAGAIVIDDLDAGFSIETSGKQRRFRFVGRNASGAIDAGLPEHRWGPPPREWSRRELATAWGRYRRTVAIVRAGGGERRAVFRAEIAKAGTWRLQCYVPDPASWEARRRSGEPGTYRFTVVASGASHSLTLDTGAAESGWNTLGELEVGGEVRVELSNESDGAMVIADAVRWQPMSGERPGDDDVR